MAVPCLCAMDFAEISNRDSSFEVWSVSASTRTARFVRTFCKVMKFSMRRSFFSFEADF